MTKQITITLVLDAAPDDETKKFGMKIVKADIPKGFHWGPTSSMARHSVLPLKADVEKEEAKKPSEPVVVKATDSDFAEFLKFKAMMAAQGSAPVPVSGEAPTLAQARKPGRPRKTA